MPKILYLLILFGKILKSLIVADIFLFKKEKKDNVYNCLDNRSPFLTKVQREIQEVCLLASFQSEYLYLLMEYSSFGRFLLQYIVQIHELLLQNNHMDELNFIISV